MKKTVFGLISFNCGLALAQQTVTFGQAAHIVLPSQQVIVEIYGGAAEKLFAQMTQYKQGLFGDVNGDGSFIDQRVGKNMTCIKREKKGEAPRFSCDLGVIGNDGSIGAGAAG